MLDIRNKLTLGVILVVAGAAAFLVFSWSGPGATFVVSPTMVVDEGTAEGTVVAVGAFPVGAPFAGRIAGVFVRGGDAVAQGDALVRMDVSGAETELEQVEAKTRVEKARLSQLLAGVLQEEVALASSQAEEARTALASARQAFEDAKLETARALEERYAFALDYRHTVLLRAEDALKGLEGIYDDRGKFKDDFIVPESAQRSEAEWQVLLARTALENIKRQVAELGAIPDQKLIDGSLSNFKVNLEVVRSLLQKTSDILTTAQVVFGAPEVEGFRTTVAVQRSVVNATQTELLKLEQGIASQKVKGQVVLNEAEQEVKRKAAALATAERELAVRNATSSSAQIAFVQATIRELESRARAIRERISLALIAAPSSGTVGEVQARVGAVVAEGTSFLSFLPDSDEQIEIPRARLSFVPRPGDNALALLAGGATVKGSVGSISDDVVTVYLASHDEQIPSRVPVRITSVVKEGALMVPGDFIFDGDAGKSVYLVEDSKKRSVPVLLGVARSGNVEVVEGLSEGDRIVRP